MMSNNSRVKIIILISGCALLALSLVLFLGAMTIRDFGQPGPEAFFNGRSSILLTVSFALLAGLSIVLLLVVSRTVQGPAAQKPSAARREERGRAVPPEQKQVREHAAASKLLSDTAGELKNSVEVIQEELESMEEEEVPADNEHLQSLHEETDRLRKIIDGMEQLSRAQALAQSRRKESVELEPLLNSIVEQSRIKVQDREIAFTLECEPGLVMTGDPECLRLIVDNLMDNAVKAVQSAGSVALSAARSGNEIVLTVRDTGTGIRAKHRSHIYERFFRGAGSGIGIGLTIVKELTDACGGKIEVQTAWSKGSVFTVHIPSS